MNEPTAGLSEVGRDPAAAWKLLPGVTLGAWLAAFWFLSHETWHRSLLGWLVIPTLLVLARDLPAIVKSSCWIRIAAALLGWQTLSRLWSGESNDPPGWWLDSLLVLGLLCVLLVTARGRILPKGVFPALAIVSATASALTLTMFYLPTGPHLADRRLRNMFFYEDGLNAVPTGFLFAFGALTAAWLTTRAASRGPRVVAVSALALSLLGLLATQSRGPMLMFAVGLLCLLAFERKRLLPALVTTVAATLVFFGVLLAADSGREAGLDLVQRGSTGRLDIYHWFLTHMNIRDILIGTGMGTAPTLAEETLGWHIDHPHSIYLTQLYQTGVVGLALLLAAIALAARSALALARRGESLWLCLLTGGCVALLVDGGQVFSVYSAARIEILLVAVPAAIAAGRSCPSLERKEDKAIR